MVESNNGTYREMGDQAPVLVRVMDERGITRHANEAWRRFLGSDADDWTAAVHPDDREQALNLICGARERNEAYEAEYRLRRHDGQYRWILDRGEPQFGPTGELLGHAAAALDVHERKEDRRRVAAELENFTYSVSHDLKAPLRTILGYGKILLQDYGPQLDEDGRRMLERQIAAAGRMEQLIKDLLESSRLDRQPLERSDFDLSALARDVAAEICNRDWGCQVRFEIPENYLTNGDPGMVRYVLQNLFENAVKYSRPGGSPFVVLGRTAEGAYFVRDNGVGFDMRYADKLFKPFERLHGASEFPGSGVGLYNVEKIVHRHGGSVWAESAPGQGATFYFLLG